MTTVPRGSTSANILTGITIIALPLVAIACSPILGVFLLSAAGFIAVPGYLFLVVMASTGFFGHRAGFSLAYAGRARIAGIGHGLSAVALVLFIIVGGDSGRSAVPILLVGLSVVFYGWLLVEWIVALRINRDLWSAPI